jgi:uncharacterized integral membrane protein
MLRPGSKCQKKMGSVLKSCFMVRLIQRFQTHSNGHWSLGERAPLRYWIGWLVRLVILTILCVAMAVLGTVSLEFLKGTAKFALPLVCAIIGMPTWIPSRHWSYLQNHLPVFYYIWTLLFTGHPCSLLDTEKIHSSLCHVAFVYILGHSCLPSLFNFMVSFMGNEFTH